MSNLRLYDPLFGTRLAKMNRLFENFWHPTLLSEDGPLDLKLDLAESDTAYTVRADMPGVKKEDIHVDVEGNHVSIRAEVKHSSEEKKENRVYSERYEGQLFRSFTLDHDVDDAKSEASFADGVLTLKLPKKANGNGKRLTIS